MVSLFQKCSCIEEGAYFSHYDAPGDVGIYQSCRYGDGQHARPVYVTSADSRTQAHQMVSDLNSGEETPESLRLRQQEKKSNSQTDLVAICLVY